MLKYGGPEGIGRKQRRQVAVYLKKTFNDELPEKRMFQDFFNRYPSLRINLQHLLE